MGNWANAREPITVFRSTKFTGNGPNGASLLLPMMTLSAEPASNSIAAYRVSPAERAALLPSITHDPLFSFNLMARFVPSPMPDIRQLRTFTKWAFSISTPSPAFSSIQ